MSRLTPTYNHKLAKIRQYSFCRSTYHPIPTLSRQLRGLHLTKQTRRSLPVFTRDSLADPDHLLNSALAKQILVVQVVEQDIETLLHVINLRFVLLRRYGLDPRDFWRQ